MWKSLNSALGRSNDQETFQVWYGECILSESKPVASRFNKYFAHIAGTVVRKLFTVGKDAWKKYEAVFNINCSLLLILNPVDISTVREILHSLKVNIKGLDELPARLLRDAEVKLAP